MSQIDWNITFLDKEVLVCYLYLHIFYKILLRTPIPDKHCGNDSHATTMMAIKPTRGGISYEMGHKSLSPRLFYASMAVFI